MAAIDRMVMLTVDDLVRLLADYCGNEDVPESSMPVAMRFNQRDKSLDIKIESPDIATTDTNRVIQAKFDLRRTFGAS